jgi:hypothetical protein
MHENDPEIRLMQAVLDHAIRCYRSRLNRFDRRSQRLFRETAQWFASDDDTWPLSFVPLCEKLNLEPEYFRAALRRWWARNAVQRHVGRQALRRRPRAVVARGVRYTVSGHRGAASG